MKYYIQSIEKVESACNPPLDDDIRIPLPSIWRCVFQMEGLEHPYCVAITADTWEEAYNILVIEIEDGKYGS